MITGRMVLFWILAFFGVIFMVNGAFVYFALDSWPGLTTDKAYEQGRDYNQTLAGAAVQNALGWSSHVEFTAESDHHVFRVTLKDHEGNLISGLVVHVTFKRPVGDERVILKAIPEVAKGDYETPVTLPLAGRWYALVEAEMDDGVNFHMRHEVTVGQ